MTLREQPATATAAAERLIIRLMFEDNAIIPYVQTEISAEDIRGEQRKTIINSLFSAYNMEKSLAADMLAVALPEAASNELSNIMLMDISISDLARTVDDCLKIIRLASYSALYERHRLRADELQRMGDSSYLQELAESQRIQDEINKLRQP
jgi:DNA primase